MPRRIDAAENRRLHLDISDEDARRIEEVGQRLASTRSWWGAKASDDDAEDSSGTSSVITCRRSSGGGWDVTFSNVVGVLAIGELQFDIKPKIGWPHFLHLAGWSSALPRLDAGKVDVAAGESLRDLVVRWFLARAEALFRADLLCDYSEVQDRLQVVKGRVDPSRLAIDFYRGRFLVDCEFEEFNVDTPHNRVIRHATQIILRDPSVDSNQRRRARALATRLDGIGPMRSSDLRVTTDRRSGFYADALLLARSLIQSSYRSPLAGDSSAWSFLLPGPALVEEGLRELLAHSLAPDFRVEKKGVAIADGLRLNADLVFTTARGTRIAVGDVKYKLLGSGWARPDLYQAVTFAEGYEVAGVAVVGFSRRGVEAPTLSIGSKTVVSLNWPLPPSDDDEDILSAEEASVTLVAHVRDWLSQCSELLVGLDRRRAFISV